MTAADICWELAPAPWPSRTPEDVDPFARISDLERERDSYRELVQVCLGALRDAALRERRDEERYQRLRDDYRSFRESILKEAA